MNGLSSGCSSTRSPARRAPRRRARVVLPAPIGPSTPRERDPSTDPFRFLKGNFLQAGSRRADPRDESVGSDLEQGLQDERALVHAGVRKRQIRMTKNSFFKK